jgi:hypothetical protein
MDLFPIDASTATTFRSLRSRLTASQALDTFLKRQTRGLRRFRRSRLRSIAQVYIPYHLFRVEVADGPRRQTSHFALDAAAGTLDLYQFPDGAADLDLVPVRSRNRVNAALSVEEAWPLVACKLQRALFQAGFFRLRDPRLSGQHESVDLHVPYWVAFYEQGPALRLEVLDAVRGCVEGGKARAVVEGWLAGAEDRS